MQKYLQPNNMKMLKEDAQLVFKLRCRVTGVKTSLLRLSVQLEKALAQFFIILHSKKNLHISFSWVEKILHTEFQLPMLLRLRWGLWLRLTKNKSCLMPLSGCNNEKHFPEQRHNKSIFSRVELSLFKIFPWFESNNNLAFHGIQPRFP